MNQSKNETYKETSQKLGREAHDFAKSYGYKSETNHNDVVDAFRHAYSAAYLSYEDGKLYAQFMGNANEQLHQNPDAEKIMDYYNNEKGYEIGEKLAKDIKNMNFRNEKEVKIYLAFQVNEAIKNNELITDLEDKRVEAMLKDPPKNPLHVYTRKEIDKMTTKEFEKNEVKGGNAKEQSGSTGGSSSDGHWVTINGNHVLLD